MGGDRKLNGQPPRPSHSSVLSWEKTFCTSICCISWERICAAKVSMSGYKSIAEWDDSGAFEAFDKAKARYWADINGLPSEIPLPDPDIYNNKVDHNPFIDPELVVDLERKPPPPPCQSNKHENLSYEAFLNATLPVVATGWGDSEDEVSDTKCEIEKPLPTTGWDDAERLPANGSSGNLWNDNGGWGDGLVSDAAWNKDSGCYSWKKQGRYASGGRHGNKEQGRRNGGNRNGYGYAGKSMGQCEIGKPLSATGWDDAEHLPANGSSGNLWDDNGGWGDRLVSDAAWNKDSGCYSWEKQERYASGGQHGNKEQGRRNGWNRNGYEYAGKSMGQWKPKSFMK